MKRILCYGDSNTWGYMPGTGERYPESIRWTRRMASLLGEGYEVLEEGLSGRTTVLDDPYSPCRNGLAGLGYALIAQKPLDLAVLMLGTNDFPVADASRTARGIEILARQILDADTIYRESPPIFPSGAKLLLVSPIHLHPEIFTRCPELRARDKYEESVKLAGLCKDLAERLSVQFLDAALYAKASEVDCVHMTQESHLALGEAMARKVKEIL